MERGRENFTVVYAFFIRVYFAETGDRQGSRRGEGPFLFLSAIFTYSQTFRLLLAVLHVK